MRLTYYILFFLFAVKGNSQDVGLFYKQFGVSDGMSSAVCTSLLEDGKGFIWIGTSGGLNCYDGHNFQTYFHKPGDPNSLCSNSISYLTLSPDKKIWIGTYGGGISVYDKSKGIFKNFRLKSGHVPETRCNRINEIAITSHGLTFASTEGGLFVLLEGDSIFRLVDDKFSNHPSFPKSFCKILNVDSVGLLWVSTGVEIYCVDYVHGKTYSSSQNDLNWEIFRIDSTLRLLESKQNDDYAWFINKSSQIFYCDQNGKLIPFNCSLPDLTHEAHAFLYSTIGRFWLFSFWNNESFILDENYSVNSDPFELDYRGSIGKKPVNAILCDHRGLEWIATGNGLFVRDGLKKTGRMMWFENSSTGVYHVIENDQGIWIATTEGLYFNSSENKNFLPVAVTNRKETVEYLFQKDEEHIWICWLDRIDEFNTRTNQTKTIMRFSDDRYFGRETELTQFIHQDHKKRIWIGTWSGHLLCIDPITFQPIFHFRGKKNDSSWPISGLLSFENFGDEIFIGFNGGDGVWQWDEYKQSFHPIINSKSHPELVAVIDDIYADDKNLYLATHGGGMAVWNRGSQQLTHYSRNQGLPGDFVYQVVPDNNGHLYLSTNAGVCVFYLENNSIEIVNNDFVQVVPLYNHSCSEISQDKIWTWMQNEILSIPIGSFDVLPEQPLITGFRLFDQSKIVFDPDSLVLNFRQNFFTIEFSAFPFLDQEHVEYSYMMTGINSDWITNDNRNLVNFTNMDDGEYEFLVRSRNYGGNWSMPSKLKLVIIPPFWKTWWFYLLMTILVCLILYGAYSYRIAQLIRIEKMRNRISHDLHDDVGASLSSINIYSKVALEKLKSDPVDAIPMLQHISHNATEMMDSMSDIVWSINPKNDTFNSLLNRIKQHATEVFTPLDIEIRYDINLLHDLQLSMDGRKNIYLICKEALNNIAKHSNATRVEIVVNQNNNDIEISIGDNGCGTTSSSLKGGNGFSNMKSRAEEIHGTLGIISEENKGTTISLHLDITRISDKHARV